MRGRAAFVYSAWTVDAIGRIRAITCSVPSGCWWHVTFTFVENRDFIHHLHWPPPLILIVYNRLDRKIQTATEMLPLNGGRGTVITIPRAFAGYASCWRTCHLSGVCHSVIGGFSPNLVSEIIDTGKGTNPLGLHLGGAKDCPRSLMGGLLQLTVPSSLYQNITAHPLTASVPTSYYSMWHYNYLCTLNG